MASRTLATRDMKDVMGAAIGASLFFFLSIFKPIRHGFRMILEEGDDG
jgi:hypothetical protein